jgi:16S rRNA (uracil1498-N3)-methyltransferase
MRLHRFYSQDGLNQTIVYKHEEHLHQWFKVFRYGVGDKIILFGDGYEHTYNINSVSKKECLLIEESKSPSKIQTKQITLAMSLIRKTNFELVLEKCTEIGVTTIIPIITERSEQHIYNIERLQKILIEATEQSGWGRVPKITEPLDFRELVDTYHKTLTVAHTGGGAEIHKGTCVIAIGPEGGFSDSEIEYAQKNGVHILTLPTGVLRAETAAIVSSALLVI